jgi:hypothetical protein
MKPVLFWGRGRGGEGAEQQLAFDEIKKYLSSPPVMKAPKCGILFQLYITAKNSVIGVVLTSDRWQGAYYYLLQPAPHQRQNKVLVY